MFSGSLPLAASQVDRGCSIYKPQIETEDISSALKASCAPSQLNAVSEVTTRCPDLAGHSRFAWFWTHVRGVERRVHASLDSLLRRAVCGLICVLQRLVLFEC